MDVSSDIKQHKTDVATLFRETFTDSEGAEEGKLIGELARELLTTTADQDLYGFMSHHAGTLTGSILFTKLDYPEDRRTVFLLAPVAVRTEWQRHGIGQRLITHGLNDLKARGVDVVVTYGDPAYYTKTGFEVIDETAAAAPMPLNYPHGWQAQSLTDDPLTPLLGPSYCVAAFNDPRLW